MTVAEMIARRTTELTAIKDDSNAAVASKGGTPADNLLGIPAAIASIPTGIELPDLTTPAEESDVLSGKEYIGSAGEKRTGTLVDQIDEVETVMGPGGITLSVESTAGASKMFEFPEPNLQPENIKSGISIFHVAGSVKEIRVETGTITPAEDVMTLEPPCTANPKMIVVHLTDASLETVVREDMVAAMRANLTGVPYELGTDSSVARVFVTNLQYHNTGGKRGGTNVICKINPVKIAGTTTYKWRAGLEYRWTAYYWEDDA